MVVMKKLQLWRFRIMDNTMALLLSDTYKQCHDRMYPKGLTKLVS